MFTNECSLIGQWNYNDGRGHGDFTRRVVLPDRETVFG